MTVVCPGPRFACSQVAVSQVRMASSQTPTSLLPSGVKAIWDELAKNPWNLRRGSPVLTCHNLISSPPPTPTTFPSGETATVLAVYFLGRRRMSFREATSQRVADLSPNAAPVPETRILLSREKVRQR